MRKWFSIAIWIAAVIALTSILFFTSNRGDDELALTDAVRFQQEYEALNGTLRDNGEPHLYMNISPDNNVVYLDYEELVDFINEGTGVFFFANASCPWCRLLIPIMLDFAEERGINLYYYNPVPGRQADTEQNQHLMQLLYDYLPVNDRDQTPGTPGFDPNLKRITVPHLFFMRNGEVVAHIMANRHEYLQDETLDLEKMKQLIRDNYDLIINGSACGVTEC
jgi:thiol-disulfide isomerase/thioredoxin